MNPIGLHHLLERTFVSYVEYHPQIDSTNNRARRIALGEEPLQGHASPRRETLRKALPCLILADHQSAGRGRGTNRWWTGPGSLAASLLMPPVAEWPQLFSPSAATRSHRPQQESAWEGPSAWCCCWSSPDAAGPFGDPGPFGDAGSSGDPGSFGDAVSLGDPSSLGHPGSLGDAGFSGDPGSAGNAGFWGQAGPEFPPGLIGLGTALAVLRTVQPRVPGLAVGLHWPNDVFAAGKKLAGILVEVLANGMVVVGIGVNTNNTVQEAPDELRPHLTTLRDLSGQIHPHEHLLLELLEHCKDVFSLAVPYPDRVASEAHRWCLQKGHLLKVQTTGGVIDGLCEGIGSRGELLLRTSDGLRRIFSGSILR